MPGTKFDTSNPTCVISAKKFRGVARWCSFAATTDLHPGFQQVVDAMLGALSRLRKAGAIGPLTSDL
jgi:hypothetical protein